MSSDLVNRAILDKAIGRGHLAGTRVVLSDPDNPSHRNVYEDLDQETPEDKRMCLVTLYPVHAKQHARGDASEGMIVVTHEQAIRDIRLMIRLGYVVSDINRDLG